MATGPQALRRHGLHMINAPRILSAFIAAVMVTALVVVSAQHCPAEAPSVPALGMYSLPDAAVPIAPRPETIYREAAQVAAPGALARLIENPDSTGGLPPFALTDRSGRIQRYVEPVPGIDLQPYVGQVVVVRHDTGRTLLATQLELPPSRLYPLLESPTDFANQPNGQLTPARVNELSHRGGSVKRAQFVDDDDATVQLLPDEVGSPGDKSALINDAAESAESVDTIPLNIKAPSFPAPMMNGEGQIEELPMGSPRGEIVEGGPEFIEAYPENYYGMEACPQCGGYHFSSECGPYMDRGHGPPYAARKKPCVLYGNVEINFLRTHLPETSAGKLSEKYEFSPRVIVGFRETEKIDGRVRYWTYDRDTAVLGNGPIRVEFDVFDVEGTHSFAGRRSEVTVGAGLRLASIDLTDDDGDTAGSDLLGMTLSAEGRAPFYHVHGCQIAGFYGGRLSILGGDWGGDPGSDFTGGLVQDDNVIVHELQAGFEIATRYRHVDVHARLGFEMQNWHSDAFSQNAGTDSIGFLGPGLHLGAEF